MGFSHWGQVHAYSTRNKQTPERAPPRTVVIKKPAMPAEVPLIVPLATRGETRRLGRHLAECLAPGDAILLEGELGAGKTFRARAIARGLGVPAGVRVTSPTFDLVHELPGRIPIVHVDLYRLEDPGELRELGITDRGAEGAVLLIERIEDRQHEHPPAAIAAVLDPIHVTLRTGLRHRPRPEPIPQGT
jgi:tRNA threonylcarbamoyl adenosine modification protein YjeE